MWWEINNHWKLSCWSEHDRKGRSGGDTEYQLILKGEMVLKVLLKAVIGFFIQFIFDPKTLFLLRVMWICLCEIQQVGAESLFPPLALVLSCGTEQEPVAQEFWNKSIQLHHTSRWWRIQPLLTLQTMTLPCCRVNSVRSSTLPKIWFSMRLVLSCSVSRGSHFFLLLWLNRGAVFTQWCCESSSNSVFAKHGF